MHRAIAAGLAVLLALDVQAAAAQGRGGLFDTREYKVQGLAPFPQWRRVLDRYPRELERGLACRPGLFTTCRVADWRRFLDGLRGLPPDRQLERVNAYLNDFEYVLDIVNWGVADYWETPPEFLDKNGDCEDYAIAKYMSLRYLGWPAEKLRIVVLFDRNTNIPHAILVAYRDGTPLILDNQIDAVVPTTYVRHYRPQYSVNETAYWKHM